MPRHVSSPPKDGEVLRFLVAADRTRAPCRSEDRGRTLEQDQQHAGRRCWEVRFRGRWESRTLYRRNSAFWPYLVWADRRRDCGFTAMNSIVALTMRPH